MATSPAADLAIGGPSAARDHRGMLLLAIVLATAAAQAPSPTAVPPRPGRVYLSGENPVVFLFDRPGGATETFVSFWRIHWSPVGPGHVCYVTSGREGTPGAVRAALHDNPELLAYLTKDVLGSYNRAYVDRPFTAIAGATFESGGDARTERRESCRAPGYAIDLAWRALRPAGLVDILPGSRPTNPFGITYLRIPAGEASVTINGRTAPGVSVPDESFLAFGETWIK
jgi:hypothetical protein